MLRHSPIVVHQIRDSEAFVWSPSKTATCSPIQQLQP